MTEAETENLIVSLLRKKPEVYRPIRVVEVEAEFGRGNSRKDIRLKLGFPGGMEKTFSIDVLGDGSPLQVRRVLERPRKAGRSTRPRLLGVPYLSERVVDILEERTANWPAVGAIDASGNYYLVQPDVVAIRLDRANRHPQSRGIKNPFRGKSSLVSRLLLSKPDRSANGEWEQVSEIQSEIEKLGGSISLSTVSKVLKRLEQEVLIHREPNSIRLLQPDTLLDELEKNYEQPEPRQERKLKLPSDARDEQTVQLDEYLDDWVWAGESCASVYTAAPPAKPTAAYSKDPIRDREELDEVEESRFYNCIVKEIGDPLPFFNRRGREASELQTYLELAQLGKREREIAAGLRETILERF